MYERENRLRDVLRQIAELANSVSTSDSPSGGAPDKSSPADPAGSDGQYYCTLKELPARLVIKAAETATKINPVNAPSSQTHASLRRELAVLDPQRIAVMTTKFWGPAPRRFTVSFMEATPADLRARIVAHMNAWNQTAGHSFVETGGIGEIRISRGAGGFFSYLGTDVLLIPQNRQTMNLQGFTMDTPESEYRRVVRHEAGHTLGFPHEHMRQSLVARIDPAKAYPFFMATQGWDVATVNAQVLTPLNEASLFGTPPDQTSIMCYQLPGLITRDGLPIIGGLDINFTDFAFAGSIFPKPIFSTPPAAADEWPESEDVAVAALA